MNSFEYRVRWAIRSGVTFGVAFFLAAAISRLAFSAKERPTQPGAHLGGDGLEVIRCVNTKRE